MLSNHPDPHLGISTLAATEVVLSAVHAYTQTSDVTKTRMDMSKWKAWGAPPADTEGVAVGDDAPDSGEPSHDVWLKHMSEAETGIRTDALLGAGEISRGVPVTFFDLASWVTTMVAGFKTLPPADMAVLTFADVRNMLIRVLFAGTEATQKLIVMLWSPNDPVLHPRPKQDRATVHATYEAHGFRVGRAGAQRRRRRRSSKRVATTATATASSEHDGTSTGTGGVPAPAVPFGALPSTADPKDVRTVRHEVLAGNMTQAWKCPHKVLTTEWRSDVLLPTLRARVLPDVSVELLGGFLAAAIASSASPLPKTFLVVEAVPFPMESVTPIVWKVAASPCDGTYIRQLVDLSCQSTSTYPILQSNDHLELLKTVRHSGGGEFATCFATAFDSGRWAVVNRLRAWIPWLVSIFTSGLDAAFVDMPLPGERDARVFGTPLPYRSIETHPIVGLQQWWRTIAIASGAGAPVPHGKLLRARIVTYDWFTWWAIPSLQASVVSPYGESPISLNTNSFYTPTDASDILMLWGDCDTTGGLRAVIALAVFITHIYPISVLPSPTMGGSSLGWMEKWEQAVSMIGGLSDADLRVIYPIDTTRPYIQIDDWSVLDVVCDGSRDHATLLVRQVETMLCMGQ